MNRLVSIIFFLVVVSLGCFAQQRTATLSHNGKLTVFNSERCLPEAYDAAVEGDTIFLSSGYWSGSESYNDGEESVYFKISKKVTFIGNGRSSFVDVRVKLDLDDSLSNEFTSVLFDGVNIGWLYLFGGFDNLRIQNCKIWNLISGHTAVKSGESQEVVIDNCELRHISLTEPAYNSGSKKKMTFYNCKYINPDGDSMYFYNGGMDISFVNCNMLMDGDFNQKVYDSILYGESYEYREKVLENCLYQWTSVKHSDLDEIYPSVYRNCYEIDGDANPILDENLNYVGPDLIASGYIGTDGTQVGIYGGPYAPYTEYPSLRCVDSENSVMTYDGYRNITLDLKFFEKESDRIVGFRSLHNSAELGYVPMDYTEGGRLKATVSIPDSLIPSLAGKTINLDRDNNEVWVDAISDDSFGIQPMTESGWGVFTANISPLVDRYSTKLVEIEKDSPGIEFEKYRGTNFHAVSFKVGAAGIYVNASQEGCFDVYNTSTSYGPMTLVASVSSEELKSGHFLDLPAGTYCGVLYDMPIDEDNPDAYITLKMGESRPESPSITYNGRFLTINTSEDNCVIKYSFDPNDTEGIYYGTPVDLDGKLGVVRAWCHRLDDGVDSNPAEFNILGYGGVSRAITSKPGVLASCYEWTNGGIPSKHFSVKGPLNLADYEWLREDGFVDYLDLTDVVGDTIPAGAFFSDFPQSLALPSGIKKISSNIFRTSHNLSALKWTSTNPIPAGMLDSLGNRNMLLYVAEASLAANVADHDHNLVIAGMANSLELHDGYPFYCPEEFTAREVVFLRNYNKETGIDGECAGWETIMLPYDVQTVEHIKGNLIPFGVNPEEERLRYWLYAPTTSGWERATSIRANEPYLIAMPNNEVYYDPFNVGGNVWFKASNVVVPPTPDASDREFTRGRIFIGTYREVANSRDNLGINPVEVFDENGNVRYRPGSVFVSMDSISPARPFEAYMWTVDESLTRAMEIFTSSEVEAVLADMEMKVWTENGGIRIQAGFTARVDVFDMTGRRVAVADVKAGEVCRVDGLAPGIYIAANRKVLLK